MATIRWKDKLSALTPLETDVIPITTDPAVTAVDKYVTPKNLSKALDLDLIPDGTNYVKTENNFTDAEKTKLTKAVLVSQATGQTIGDTTNRLTKLWATDITVTNAISGSVTGNAGTVTNGVYTTGDQTIAGEKTLSDKLTITKTLATISSGPNYLQQNTLTVTDTSATSGVVSAGKFETYYTGSNSGTLVINGVSTYSQHGGSTILSSLSGASITADCKTTATNVYGQFVTAGVSVDGSGSGGTVTNLIGGLFYNSTGLSGDTVTNSYGVKIETFGKATSSTITNNYGLYIDDQSSVGSTLSYNLFSAGVASKNLFEGKTFLGKSNSTDANLNIVKATSGTATNEGDFVYNGTNLYFKPSGTVVDLLAGGGISWGSSIAGTSGTGLAMTISNNASAGTIAHSIIMGNTQTNPATAIMVDMGTANVVNNAMDFRVLRGNGMLLNKYGSATQAVGNVNGIYSGQNFNTNSAFHSYGWYMDNEQNEGTGRNVGLSINNKSTDFDSTVFSAGSGIYIAQTGVGGTAVGIRGNDNVNSSTNGLVNYTLSNTQSAATVMQKIDTGTSAQVHTGLLVNLVNASTGAKGVQVDLGSTGTGIGYDVVSSSLAGIRLYQGSVTASGNLTSDTKNKVSYLTTRTHTATTTISDNYNVVFAQKTSRVNNASATYNATGAVFYAGNVVTNFAGTINDSSIVLELVQDIDSTGNIASFKTGATEYVGVSVKGNLLINTPTQNGNLVGGIVMKNGTVASASVTDGIQIYSADTSDSTATLALYTEQAVEEIGTFTESHKLKVFINGTAYWISLDQV